MRFVLICLLCCAACQQPLPERQPVAVTEDSTFLTGTFYLVSHVDSALYQHLKDADIDKVYFTSAPVDLTLKADTVSYEADSTGEGLIYEITRHDDWGKRLLIVGSGTLLLPAMRSLKAKLIVDTVGENELYVLRKNRDSVSWKVQRFE